MTDATATAPEAPTTTSDVPNQITPPVPDTQGMAPDRSGQAPQAAQPQAPQPKPSLLGDILRAVGSVLGGPSTQTQVDPNTGAQKQVPFTRAQRIANTGGILLRGAGAGLAQHGPGAFGRSIVAGGAAEDEAKQQQQKQANEQSENVRQTQESQQRAQLTQASLAKSSQDMARTALDMKAKNIELNEHQVGVANAMQKIASVPGAVHIGHFDSNDDINTHLEQVGPDLAKKYAVDLAKNEVTLVPNPDGGFDAYQVPKDWHNQPIGPGNHVATFTVEQGKDGKPKPVWKTIPAPDNMTMGDYQLWNASTMKASSDFDEAGAKLAHEKAATAHENAATTKENLESQKLKQEIDEAGGNSPLIDEIGTGKMPAARLEYIIARKPELMEQVAKKYPDFDGSKVKAYIDTYHDFAGGGKTSVALNSGATALKHLSELRNLNTYESRIPGTGANKAFHNKLDTVVPELITFYQMPHTNESINTLKHTLGGLTSRDAAITEQVKSMGDKFDSFEQTWKNAAPSKAYEAPMPGVDAAAKIARASLDHEYLQRIAPPNASNVIYGGDGKTPIGFNVNNQFVPIH